MEVRTLHSPARRSMQLTVSPLILAAAAFSIHAAPPGDVTSEPHGGASRVGASPLDTFALEKAAELRAKLQTRFSETPRTLLLHRKERVDTFLSTFLLVDDVMTRSTWSWWSLVTEEFRGERTQPRRVTGPAEGEIGQGLLQRGSHRFLATLAWHAPCGEGPPLMLWTNGTIAAGTGEATVRYHEPYLANSQLNFTLHPERLVLRWTPDRLQLLDQGGARLRVEESVNERPKIFNNTHSLYVLFDSLRLKLGDHGLQELGSRSPISPSEASWEVTRADGRPSRTVLRSVEGDAMRIEIRQAPVALRHLSSETYAIEREQTDGRVHTEAFVPTLGVEYLTGGREIDIELRRRDEGWFPKSVIVSAAGTPLFEATFEPRKDDGDDESERLATVLDGLKALYVAAERGHPTEPPVEYPLGRIREAGPHLRRAMLKHNVYRSLVLRDVDSLTAWLDEYRAMLEAEGTPLRFHVHNIEAATQAASDFVDTAFAVRVVTGPLRREYERTEPQELAEHAARLISQYRVGLAIVALDVLSKSSRRAAAAWATRLRGDLAVAWSEGEIEPGDDFFHDDRSARLTGAIMESLAAESTDAAPAEGAPR